MPRNPKIKGDKGILMCFHEEDGKFLWQAVHDKLRPAGSTTGPRRASAPAPFVEGNRLYYVSNRCEVVCADVNGRRDRQGQGRLEAGHDQGLNVFPHNLATCSPLIVGDTLFVITSNGVETDRTKTPYQLCSCPQPMKLRKSGEVGPHAALIVKRWYRRIAE